MPHGKFFSKSGQTRNEQAWQGHAWWHSRAMHACMHVQQEKSEGKIDPLTLAAKVNSRSSDRKEVSSMAVLMTSSSNASSRKRYSVTPSQMRNNWI